MAAITAGDCRRLKVQRILETAGQEVLTFILLCGMPDKAPTDTLVQYLSNLPQGSTANFPRGTNPSSRFTRTDLSQINGDPSCTTFDVTLLHKAIKLACEQVAGPNETVNGVNKWSSVILVQNCELEHYSTKLKDYRNAVMHECQPLTEGEFRGIVVDLTYLFDSCLRATKDRYGVDDADYQTKRNTLQDKVAAIRDEDLGAEEILERSASALLPLFKKETDEELRASMDRVKYLTPLHFLSGHENWRVDVGEIFCDILLVEEKSAASQGDEKHVNYLEVLQLCDTTTVSPAVVLPQILLVEGEAGSGKSSLANFLLAQWLALKKDRRVQGLDNYELVMWVVCREKRSTTLQDLLGKWMPESYIKYGSLLLPLLGKLRVLVIIDGLDERNKDSGNLVDDILSKATTTFTIVCTSRPESVQDMKRCVTNNFQVSHVRLKGITDTKRTELVEKHYKWLSGGTLTDDLRRQVEDISSKDMMRLPINLLFLATLLHHNRSAVGTTMTQADIYYIIHKWSVEKLLARLAAPSKPGKASVLHQNAVKEVLDTVYKVALKGLLEDRVYLSSQEVKNVSAACTAEDLNCDNILSTFFSLRREEGHSGLVETSYQAPHKGLQEYLAAMYVSEHVSKDNEEAIQHVLMTLTEGRDPPFQQLTNMLRHLLAVLARQSGDVTAAMKEAVELMRPSVNQRDWGNNDWWLELLADIAAPDTLVRYVADGLKQDEGIRITDQGLQVALVTLQHLQQPWSVTIYLTREKAGVEDMLLLLPHRHHVMELHLWHHKLTQQHDSGPLLQSVQRSHLERFTGLLEQRHLVLLPPCLKELRLAVRDDSHAQTLLPALAAALNSLPRLKDIWLHIPVGVVTPGAITSLPPRPWDIYVLRLVLSGVTEQLVEATGDIVAAITTPETSLRRLLFPGASVRFTGWRHLILKLHEAGVRLSGGVVCVPETCCITDDEDRQLRHLTETMLGGYAFYRWDDEMIWRNWYY